jgi:transcriptional regulator with PAS, ATPase and Fis domain
MKYLYSFMKNSHFGVTLFDARGYLLEIMMTEEYLEASRRRHWTLGALWDEATAGNNAVGTVVTLRNPLRIFGPQHYNRSYHRDTVASAPIYDPEGTFLGGITITGFYYATTSHTLGMTVAAAKAIENQLQIQKALREAQIASAYQKTVMAFIPEALIAIDNQGRISLLNENARILLRLEGRQVVGEHISRVFGPENRRFLSLIESRDPLTDVEVRIFAAAHGQDYTLSVNPILSPQGEVIGKILTLNEIHRVKTLVNKMIGAKANFRFSDICGENPEFLKTVEQARMVSSSTSNVLLLGKSGTGKDLFAQAIHNASSRRHGPYLAINCAAIPRDLITSELFGYSEGSFTGSRRGGNQGKFELADTGTIFLDEIAETPLELQAVLLRVIEDKSVVRIGGKRVRPVDVRIIAATNKDLLAEVRKGNFREDLYYRLNVFSIHLIPLHRRRDDIPLLVEVFLQKYGRLLGKKIERIDPAVMEIFYDYPWPGNVRELQNVVERMMNFSRSAELTADLIPPEILEFAGKGVGTAPFETPFTFEKGGDPLPRNRGQGKDRGVAQPLPGEREAIRQMLALGLKKKTIAERMSLSRMTLYRKMKRYGLSRQPVKQSDDNDPL